LATKNVPKPGVNIVMYLLDVPNFTNLRGFANIVDQSDREDYLEALLRDSISSTDAASLAKIGTLLDREIETVRHELILLEKEGDLILAADGGMMLTDQGREIGECVLRKHTVLQSFLSEMLGMDEERADREACALEHEASDETISRLSDYLNHTAPCRRQRRLGVCPADRPCMEKLTEAEENEVMRVVSVHAGRGKILRLNDLGVVPGEEIRILRKLPNGTIMVEIKGSEVALSSVVAGAVSVEKMA